MKARNIPAAFYRKYSFCFENFKDFDAELWKKVKEEADGMRNTVRLSIVGSDIDTDATDIAKTSTLEMRLTTDVRINRRSVREQTRMTQEGVVITCPPTKTSCSSTTIPSITPITCSVSSLPSTAILWIISNSISVIFRLPRRAVPAGQHDAGGVPFRRRDSRRAGCGDQSAHNDLRRAAAADLHRGQADEGRPS